MTNPIVVSGATSGIGLELAKALILQGNSIYAVGRNYDKFLTSIYAWCLEKKLTELCNWIQYDFSNPTEFQKDEFDKLPVVSGFVNCAGVLPISPLRLQKSDDIVDSINVNLLSPILFTRELLKSNRLARGSSLVYMSSINGVKVGSKAHTCYSATKAGISGFVMSLANEVSTLNIRVNAIAPGTVDTPMLAKTKKLVGDDTFSGYIKQYPLGIGSPDSLIPLIMFLLDNKSSQWITGQNFIVDGGYSLN